MSLLNEQELKQIAQRLQAHREALQAHLRGTQRAAETERYEEVAGSVHSQSDESFAELSAALSHASRGREAEVLQDIEEALLRLRARSYGTCVDCGQTIALERLRAYPTAKRCLSCQQRKEDKHGGKDQTPSL